VVIFNTPVYKERKKMKISIETTIDATLETVWSCWITPQDIMNWNFATEDWSCPRAELDFTEGGRFNYRMEAKDGSAGFDFEGTFTSIKPQQEIAYALDDDRKVQITFSQTPQGIIIKETFDAEEINPPDMQRQGWQNILNNFKTHVESKGI
jgi:uncharacterized protein YndB with AHSA1/START domain